MKKLAKREIFSRMIIDIGRTLSPPGLWEGFWFVAAVLSALVYGYLIVLAFSRPVATLQAFTGFGGNAFDALSRLTLTGAGLVTFCTVVWRGLITTRQANAQLKQVQEMGRSISIQEDNNAALLLQKAAELLKDEAETSQYAGIASLEFIVASGREVFAQQAMNLLGDYLQERFRNSHGGPLFQSARLALETGFRRGFKAERSIVFGNVQKQEAPNQWLPILGLSFVTYNSGFIHVCDDRIEHVKGIFNGVRIIGGILRTNDRFRGCKIEKCKITHASGAVLRKNHFRECDFSGAKLLAADLRDLREGGNYYRIGDPPVVGGFGKLQAQLPQPNWEDLLTAKPMPG